MTYSTEGGMPTRRRKQRRAAIVIGTLLVLLIGALVAALGVNQGWFAKPASPATTKSRAKSTCATTPLVAPSTVTVNVYNATERSGIAKATATSLVAQGFKLGSTANDPLNKTVPGVAEVRHGPKGAGAAAAVAARVTGAALVKDDRADASVDLVLGEKFASVIVPKAAPTRC